MINRILLYTVNTGAIIACVFNDVNHSLLPNTAHLTVSRRSLLCSWYDFLLFGGEQLLIGVTSL